MSDKFLTDHLLAADSVFGPPGQVFVYEWSKLRYGVFSEHGYPGDSLYPMFYHKQIWTADGTEITVKPNLCTNVEPEGSSQTVSGEECQTDPVSGLPATDCIFSATLTDGLTSSVMALPYLPGNIHWCDRTEEHVHDDELPTKHNTFCAGENVFDVVRRHEDFQNFQPSIDEVNTTPNFTLLRPGNLAGSFVFVLDNSGSMYGNAERSERMKKGVERFMLVDVDLNKQFSVGAVKFSKDAQIIHDVVQINDENVRNEIIDSVNGLTEDGGTCLGFGIFKGLDALKKSGLDEGGSAIFLTDGEQNCGSQNSTVQDAIASVVAQKVRVCTIAFGSQADQELEKLAAATGGAAFFVPDDSGPADINNALASCLDFLPSVETREKNAIILQETFRDKRNINTEVVIDQFSGREVTIQIDYEKVLIVVLNNILILDGDLQVTNATITIGINDTVIKIDGSSVKSFNFPTVAPGQYNVTVQGIPSTQLVPIITSHSRGEYPVTHDARQVQGARQYPPHHGLLLDQHRTENSQFRLSL